MILLRFAEIRAQLPGGLRAPRGVAASADCSAESIEIGNAPAWIVRPS